MSKFPRVLLGELIVHQKGSPFKSKDYQKEGIPVVRVSNFTSDSIDTADLKYVSSNVASQNHKVTLKADDIVIATVGSWPKNPASIVGKTISVPLEMNGALMNQNSVILRAKSGCSVDQKYLFIALKTKIFSDYLVSTAQGSANQASVTLGDIFGYEIEWPNFEIRHSIVSAIDSINQKVRLNRQTNQTLENIAQAIFKSWFVDFEPTRAKIAAKQAGQDPERAAMAAISSKALEELDQLSSEQLEQLKTTAALFPDEMVDSEFGEVPDGWLLGELQNIAEFSTERVNTSELTLETYVSTESMLEGKKGVSIASSLPSVKTVPKFGANQILISNIRPYFMKIWLARFEGGRSNDVLGFEAKQPEDVEYLYNLLYQNEFFNFMMTTSKGAKMPRGDKKAIMGWTCTQPTSDVKKAYSTAVGRFYDLIDTSNKESKRLEGIRDALLPKLLSGELKIPTKNTEAEVA